MDGTNPTLAGHALHDADEDDMEAMSEAERAVFVVDGCEKVRLALSSVLGGAGYAVRLFESAEDFVAMRNPESCGCVLLDTCLSGMSGLELQRLLEASPCSRPIIFLSSPCEIRTSVEAMKAGAVDFLTKPPERNRLLVAVAQAFERDAGKRRAEVVRRIIQRRLNTLTRRERQVMAQIICGRLNKQIAADFGSGEKTVKVHRARLMRKMQVRCVPELVLLGARIGMTIESSRSTIPVARGRSQNLKHGEP